MTVKQANEIETNDSVVSRLKAAGERETEQDREAGIRAGRRWAEKQATPKQLDRLSDFEGDEDDLNLYLSLCPGEFDQRDMFDFWDAAIGDGNYPLILDDDFRDGFIVGALEVWDEVKSKL